MTLHRITIVRDGRTSEATLSDLNELVRLVNINASSAQAIIITAIDQPARAAVDRPLPNRRAHEAAA